MIEKLPTGGNSNLDPSTSSIRPDVGTTAAEGERAGQAANQEFNRQLNEQFNRPQPGNSPYQSTTKEYD